VSRNRLGVDPGPGFPGGELDLLVPPLDGAVVAGDQAPPGVAVAVMHLTAGVASGHTAVATNGSPVREAGEEAGHRRQLGVARAGER
jgi:hypothetical protein